MASSKTRDLTLAAIHRNILMECARFDIDVHTIHIPGKTNVVADALCRLSFRFQTYSGCQQLCDRSCLD